MKTEKIEYRHGPTKFIGELFFEEASQTKPRPGVLVFPDAFGLREHARERARRLSKLGYIALAVDPYGEGRVFGNLSEVGPSIQELIANRTEWRAKARAAFDALIAQPQVDGGRIAAIGFCFGGSACLELARSGAPLSAIVTFHASLLPELPEDLGRIQAKVMICHGADDPLVSSEIVKSTMRELTRDKVDWQWIYYGNTAHGFSDPEANNRHMPGLAYNKNAEDRSWSAMKTVFDEVFS